MMNESPVFGHAAEPSPRDLLERGKRNRNIALRASMDLLAERENRPGDHDRWRYNVARHTKAIAAFDAAIAALDA
jgi:hypothetical protein